MAGVVLSPGVGCWNRRPRLELLTPASSCLCLFRPRVHLLQQPQRVQARIVIGPDRGMSLPPSAGCGVLLALQRGRVAGPSPQARGPGRFQRPLFLACFGPSRQWSSQPRPLVARLLQVDDFRTLLLREEIPPAVRNLKPCFLICLLPDLRKGSRRQHHLNFPFSFLAHVSPVSVC